MRFKRSDGLTASEQLLAQICDRSFLKLWTYPNLFKKPGKELTDLLVVFGNDVIIFSDKSCGRATCEIFPEICRHAGRRLGREEGRHH
jgi:hypothetical protein